MDKFLLSINQYIHDETPDFRAVLITGFKMHISAIKIETIRNRLQLDEIDFLNTVDDLLVYAGADPTPEERNQGIVDQYEFQQQLKDLKAQNASLWTRYGLH